jgi:hypothetical protein
MKRSIAMGTLVALLLLGIGASAQTSSQSSGQSLGDAARAARKKKGQTEPASKHFDNDNLPTTETLSVVGPEPTATSPADQQAIAQQAEASKKADAEARQQATNEMQKKLDEQKSKIDQLAHELDLDQREYRLRAVAYYGDAGTRLRDKDTWDKDETNYKTEIESKQKALDDAKAQLGEFQEEARKAGMKQKEADAGASKDSDKSSTDDNKK